MAHSVRNKQVFTGKVDDFDNPTQLPIDKNQAAKWQQANKQWWETAPMRYDWTDEIAAEPGEPAYFEEIDKRFFGAVKHYLPWQSKPFDSLINFPSLANKSVLEIGVGHGSHAQLIAPHCKHYTGIDLTHKAVEMTRKRLEQQNIGAHIEQMDAEKMTFPNDSFDFIWSWGVIHHSANTLDILKEMNRVLRPNGSAQVMVYHRSPWKYYMMDGFLKGVISGELFRQNRGLLGVNQSQTDGAIARCYRVDEWRAFCQPILPVVETRILGQKLDVIPLPGGRLKSSLEKTLPDAACRFLTNTLRFGSFLVSRHTTIDHV